MERKDFFELWIKALESGEYKQIQGSLVNDEADKIGFCCLGVACDVAEKVGFNVPAFYNMNYLPVRMQNLLGTTEEVKFIEPVRYRGRDYESLAEMNDKGMRFKTIARIIREQFALGNFEKP